MKHNLLVLVMTLAAAAAAAPSAVLFIAAASAAPNTAISELESQRRASQLTTIRQASISSGLETGAAEAAAEKTIRVQRTWPCYDRCGGCSTNSDPPEYQCHDLVRRCHPSCRSCVRSPLSVEPPLFQCSDRIPGYCRRRCNSDHGLQIL